MREYIKSYPDMRITMFITVPGRKTMMQEPVIPGDIWAVPLSYEFGDVWLATLG